MSREVKSTPPPGVLPPSSAPPPSSPRTEVISVRLSLTPTSLHSQSPFPSPGMEPQACLRLVFSCYVDASSVYPSTSSEHSAFPSSHRVRVEKLEMGIERTGVDDLEGTLYPACFPYPWQ